MWLPPNATSLHQPLDQGNSKYVRFMVQEFNEGRDPKASMHVLRAIRWGISAWEQDVTATIIQNCWIRSQCYDFAGTELTGDKWSDSRGLMTPIVNDLIRLKNQGRISERMDIQNFLNPVTEEVDDHEKDVLEAIVARYGEEREAESGEEVEEVAVVSMSEAFSALKVLQTYEEQQGSGDPSLVKAFRGRERELQLQKTAGLRQGSLKDWLGDK